jgi:hypothetical protein
MAAEAPPETGYERALRFVRTYGAVAVRAKQAQLDLTKRDAERFLANWLESNMDKISSVRGQWEDDAADRSTRHG